MKKIVFITPMDAEPGFLLAGISQQTAGPAEAVQALQTATADPDAGLIVVDERLLEGLSEEQLREMEKDWAGIILVLPSPEKLPPDREDYAARLIRRAIGYQVRLNL